MRIIVRFLLPWLLAVPALSAGADKLQEALTALASKDPSSYEKATDYITKHPRDAEPSLRKLFQSSNEALVRLRAAKLLGDLADRGAIDDLKKTLLSGGENNAAVRVEIIRSLSKLGHNDILLEYLDSGREASPTAKAAVAIALQGSTDEKSKEALSHLLRSDDRRVFRAAAFAVSRTYSGKGPSGVKLKPTAGDRAIFEALKSKENDPDTEVRQTAASIVKNMTQVYEEL